MAAAPLQGVIRHLSLAAAARNSAGVSDAQLLERFLSQRDEAAFELLVWRHGKMVLGTCRRLLRDAHEAEDAFQACFVALARRAGSIGRRESVGGWLHKVAYRLALGAKSRRARRDAREQPLGDRTPAAGSPDPAAEAAGREVRHALSDEVGRLPNRYRVPFVLCCLEGRSNADVARELGCAVGTVESRLSRARQRLRAGLSRRGVTLPVGLLAALSGPGAASAFVPAALVVSTAQAATLIAAGQTAAAGVVSAHVAAMAEGVLRAMLMTKLKTTAAILLAVALTGTGAGVLTYRTVAAQQPGPAAGAMPGPAPAAADAARIAKLIGQLGSSALAERDKAVQELEEIGAPALGALRAAARAGDAEQRRRVEDLVTKIEGRKELADLLAPKRLHLVYQDTPLAEAVADFKVKSGYDLSLSDAEGKLKGRTVTLDTGDVTFWQALGQFCRQARLVEAPAPAGPPPGMAGAGFAGGGFGGVPGAPPPGGGFGGVPGVPPPGGLPQIPPGGFGGVAGVPAPGGGGIMWGAGAARQSTEASRIVLLDGQPPTVPTDDSSAVRISARKGTAAPGASPERNTLLVLEVAPEPKLRLQRVVSAAVGKAVDDQGQTLEPVKPVSLAPNVFNRIAPAGVAPVLFTNVPKGATSLREVSGTVTAQVLKAPQPYLVVIDLLGSAGKSIRRADGGALQILDVSRGRQVQVRFTIAPPARLLPAGGLSHVTQRGGRLVVSGRNGDGPEHEFAVVDTKGAVLAPVGVGVHANAGAVEYVVSCQPREGQGEPAELIYTVSPSVTIEVPFTLRNVPLP